MYLYLKIFTLLFRAEEFRAERTKAKMYANCTDGKEIKEGISQVDAILTHSDNCLCTLCQNILNHRVLLDNMQQLGSYLRMTNEDVCIALEFPILT